MTDRSDLLRDDILAGPAALSTGCCERTTRRTRRSPPSLASLPAGRTVRVRRDGQLPVRSVARRIGAACRGQRPRGWSTPRPARPRRRPRTSSSSAISASGRTAEVMAAARRHRGQSLVVAVTNDPESALASEADHVLPLLAGSEASGIATRTFRATVAVLAMLGGHSAGVAVRDRRGARGGDRVGRALGDGHGEPLSTARRRSTSWPTRASLGSPSRPR